jgi:membrane protein YqaA with SNARE-associated domain
MRLFSILYDKIIQWAKHPRAPFYLAALSFAESSIFPIPPDFMLAPMILAKPLKVWRYALITTSSSVLGGVAGYSIGFFFIKLAYPFIVQLGYQPLYQQVESWFLTWGIWILLFAGFTPIPYKLFTIASGAVGLPLLPFVLASIVGRGARFFLVATLLDRYGDKMQSLIQRYADHAGWFVIAAVLFLCIGIKFW